MFRFRTYSIPLGITLFIFGVFAIIWFCVFNRYTILYYQEQMQLFRFESSYFLSFFDRPGGLSEYVGAFFTQFYFYPFAGAIILTIILTTVVLLFYYICRSCGNIRQMFFIPFIPAVLLMTSFGNAYFDMSAALGVLLVLAGFRVYIAMSLPVRYIAGMVLITATYFIAGGNALLLAVLILIFELSGFKSLKEQTRKRDKLLYLLLLAGWTALLPWLSLHLFYTVMMHEAYFALTPANFIKPTIDSKLLWLSIPVLYLVWILIVVNRHCVLNLIQDHPQSPATIRGSRVKHGMTALNCLLVVVMTGYCAYTMFDRRANIINKMTFELQHNDYGSALATGKKNPTNNRLVCYLANIALYESGQMPDSMFHYKQLGTAGLFLNWEFVNAGNLVWYLGEVYYRLGMILQAEHCTFESLVSSQKGPGAKILQRLVLTNIARRDVATADKYLRYLDHSLFYRKWSRQQRTNLALAMADSTFHIPGTPIPVQCKDFFIPYQVPEYTLLMLLEANPKHRMAFEYLMAYSMLQRDLEKVKWCMDNYYKNFDYPAIPIHYEEALLLYKNVYDESPDFFSQYPVSNATLERYNRYMQAVNAAQGSKRKFEQFQKQFGNTYWYYMNLINPATLKK